tara:strand:+ start:1103 stop:1258 length:156 start_codon:yes stop_codon:yes gene_type:complete
MNRTVIPEFVVKSVIKMAIKKEDTEVLLSLCEKGYTEEVKKALKWAGYLEA